MSIGNKRIVRAVVYLIICAIALWSSFEFGGRGLISFEKAVALGIVSVLSILAATFNLVVRIAQRSSGKH